MHQCRVLISTKYKLQPWAVSNTLDTISKQHIVHELTKRTCIIKDELKDSTTTNASVTIHQIIVEQNCNSTSDNIKVNTSNRSGANVVVAVSEDRLEECTVHEVRNSRHS